MKILSWNCNGRFRSKLDDTLNIEADIYVIQECENPEKYPKVFQRIVENYLWFGVTDNKGICVFSLNGTKLDDNGWNSYGMRHYLSVKVNDTFDLLAVWACPPYIEEYYVYQQIYGGKYNDGTVLIGDFNSNAIWDKQHRERNHMEVVRQLQAIGLESAYHVLTEEDQGKETVPTFYLHRNGKKQYHIDYCFLNPGRLIAFTVGDSNEWLPLSDHMPIIVEVDVKE